MLTRLLLLLTLWMGSLTVSAQDADSINQAAQHPEFIHVYLVTIGPDNDAVSAYGHAAIRLQCESKQLDYCFSFNMSDTGLAPLKFVAGTAKAGFQAVPTDRFVEQYRQEGRAVSEYQLNLLPLEEQQLWRLLDEEIMKGAYWKYDFITVNCTSMCVWIVQRALTGERLFCRNMPPALSRPYKELLHEISAHSPWMELFFNIRLFSRRNDIGTPDAKMVPDVLAAVWSDSQIEDSAGNQRSMIVGSRTICQQTVALTSPLVTPCMAAWMVVVVVLAAGGMLWHKRKRNVLPFNRKVYIMKKFFTNLKAKRLMVSASLIAVFSLPASASDTWYAYHAQVEAYPTGAGQVYISTEYGVPESERQYSERQTKEIVAKYSTLYVYPKANEGWQCIGVTTDELNENEEWVYVESLSSIVYPDQEYITVDMPNGIHTKTIDPVTGTEQDADSATTATLMPLDPNNSFKTIFTHVAVDEFDDQDALGSTTISKLANDIGDKVTLTATPNDERCHFVKWTLDGKDVSTEASIDVDVTGVATYLAHFTADSAEVLHFAEEGEYKMWYSPDTRISIPSNVNYFFLYADSVQKEGDKIVAKPSPYRYSVDPGIPTILYGKGDAQIVKTPASPYGFYDNLFAYSGADGVKIDTLDVEKKYYTFDTNAVVFNQVSGTIAPNTVYVGIPDSVFTNAGKEVPATIPLKNQSSIATGIAAPVAKPVAIRKGIYTIDGRRVDAMEQNGVYIYDGKKVLYRKGK